MLDKIIRDHIDEMEAIENNIEKEIDELLKGMDVDALMNDPEAAIMEVVNILSERLIQEYIPRAAEKGIEFAKKIQETKKDIVVQDTTNPKVNQGLANDSGRD